MDGFVGTRNAMLGLWLLMRGAPENVRDLYRELDEETLQADALEARAPWCRGRATLPPAFGMS